MSDLSCPDSESDVVVLMSALIPDVVVELSGPDAELMLLPSCRDVIDDGSATMSNADCLRWHLPFVVLFPRHLHHRWVWPMMAPMMVEGPLPA